MSPSEDGVWTLSATEAEKCQKAVDSDDYPNLTALGDDGSNASIAGSPRRRKKRKSTARSQQIAAKAQKKPVLDAQLVPLGDARRRVLRGLRKARALPRFRYSMRLAGWT